MKPSKDILARVEHEAREHPDDLVALLSADGVFLYVSPSVVKILGFAREYAIGRSVKELFQPVESTHIDLTFQDAILHGESVETTRNTPLAAGGYRRMRGAVTMLVDEKSDATYILSIAHPMDVLPDQTPKT